MTTVNTIEWVRSIQLPFAAQQEVATEDWQQVAAQYYEVVPIRACEPLRQGVPFLHRQTALQFGSVKALVTAHNGLRLEGERTLAGSANVRISLVGRARIQHRGQELLLGPGRLLFDYDDDSAYTARTESQAMLLVLGLAPTAIAAAAAALAGPQADPDLFLGRLPEQVLLTEERRSTGIVNRQILRILQLADRALADPGRAQDLVKLEGLLHRSLALVLFPEFLKAR
ncbi:MAG: hypothetical protein VKK97_04285 [Synechococcaceae cyanobacterium]|jgi:hypothetical protein|nr:hypothetical protein [Synechococcaceae cyanobacterium]